MSKTLDAIEENIFNMIDAENYSFRDGSNFFVQANFNPQYKETMKGKRVLSVTVQGTPARYRNK